MLYRVIEDYIDDVMLPAVAKATGMRLQNTKYRVSNNNNSTDAGSYHRDLQVHDKVRTPNVYTVSYLDPGVMQLIPKSYQSPHMGYPEAVKALGSSVRL